MGNNRISMVSTIRHLAIRLQNMYACRPPTISEVEAEIEDWLKGYKNELEDPKKLSEYAADAMARVGHPSYKGWWRHRHQFQEFFYDLRADEIGGPKTWHGIGWVCCCGRVDYVDYREPNP